MFTEKLTKLFSLGFENPPDPSDVPLMLGKKRPNRRQTFLWEAASWLLMACGIFLRKGLMVAKLSWVDGTLTPGAFFASAVIALAAFPVFMRWFNRRHLGASLENFATAFAFGFFLDLASFAAYKIAPHWRV